VANEVKYSSYTANFKLKVTEYTEKHSNKVASHEFTMSKFSCALLEEAENIYIDK
jgi:hypothetical protein